MTQVLHFYSWLLMSLLILIIGAIGYFYQKKFNIKTNYYLFIIAAVLTSGELLQFVAMDYVWIEYIEMAGVLLAALLTLKLYKAMTGAM